MKMKKKCERCNGTTWLGLVEIFTACGMPLTDDKGKPRTIGYPCECNRTVKIETIKQEAAT
jgi:hypothetical protein